MAVNTYTPSENKIIHWTGVDFGSRPTSFQPVHLVQYDQKLPIVAVNLYKDGQVYRLPTAVTYANIRSKKRDGTFVSNPVLGCNSARNVLYFEATYQMLYFDGTIKPILEIQTSSTEIAGSSPITIIVDRNPVQEGDIESSNEYKSAEIFMEEAQKARDAAQVSEKNAKTSETNAKNSETKAAASASNAKTSETNAKNSETAAATSASNAKTSETNAKNSETKAKASETAAAESESNAAASASNAKTSETNAKNSQTAAATSASNAATSATTATNKAKEASDYANTSKSYAVGGTGTRTGEDTDNSKYYYEQAMRISQGLEGALLPIGTITFAELATSAASPGYMYNISNAFTSDSRFKDGGNKYYGAGSNVYYTADKMWDVLASVTVTGVKGNAETTYRTGNVNLTPKDIGALGLYDTAAKASVLDSSFSLTLGNLGKAIPQLGGKGFTDIAFGFDELTEAGIALGSGVYYGTCETAAGTRAKVVTVSANQNFYLTVGCVVAVKFTNTNTYSATADAPVTLNVNNTGAKNIYYNNTPNTTGSSTIAFGYANRYNYYVYDGTYWVWMGQSVDNNTTYSAMSTSELTTGTATTSRVVRADYLKTGIETIAKSVAPNVVLTDTIVSGVTWNAFKPSLFNSVFGSGWISKLGIYTCRGNVSDDASGLIANKVGGTGTYYIRIDVWINGYCIIEVADSDHASYKYINETQYIENSSYNLADKFKPAGANIDLTPQNFQYYAMGSNQANATSEYPTKQGIYRVIGTKPTGSPSSVSGYGMLLLFGSGYVCHLWIDVGVPGRVYIGFTENKVAAPPVWYSLHDSATREYNLEYQPVYISGKDSSIDFAEFIKVPLYKEDVETDENGNEYRIFKEVDEEEHYIYALQYEEFISSLMKKLQIQQNEVETLKVENLMLKEQVSSIMKQLGML